MQMGTEKGTQDAAAISGQDVTEPSAVGYAQWREEGEPRGSEQVGAGGKHFALSWGGLCAGSGISGAG